MASSNTTAFVLASTAKERFVSTDKRVAARPAVQAALRAEGLLTA